MQIGCRHDIGPKVYEQVVIHQRRRTFADTLTSEFSCSLTIIAAAKRFWISICCGSSKKCDNHLGLVFTT